MPWERVKSTLYDENFLRLHSFLLLVPLSLFLLEVMTIHISVQVTGICTHWSSFFKSYFPNSDGSSQTNSPQGLHKIDVYVFNFTNPIPHDMTIPLFFQGKNLLVIGTTSELAFLESLGVCDAFSVVYNVPVLKAEDAKKVESLEPSYSCMHSMLCTCHCEAPNGHHTIKQWRNINISINN